MNYIVTYFPEYKKNALTEIQAVDKLCTFKELSKNIALVKIVENPKIFIKKLSESSPIFVRHIMPVQKDGDVTGDRNEDCKIILERSKSICNFRHGQYFSVQCRIINGKLDYVSKDIEVFVGTYFESIGAVSKFSDTSISNDDVDIISVLISENKFYIGLSNVTENLNSHSDEYRVLSRGNGKEISRAGNKLKEAINKFSIQIKGEGYALDIGASPGGWTKVLADYGYTVIAVDPGDLHESLKENKSIIHYKDRIENVEINRDFDIIVNDMNVDPQITAKIMCGLADRLSGGSLAIVTLKLPFSDVDRSLKESTEIIKKYYEIVTIKNLSHNRREVTALLKKKN